MRIGFKTTIEKELIESLKKNAVEHGLNVNDILEPLIRNYLESQEFIGFIEFETLPGEDKLNRMMDGLMEIIDDYVYKHRIDYRDGPREIISDVIKSVFRHLMFVESKK